MFCFFHVVDLYSDLVYGSIHILKHDTCHVMSAENNSGMIISLTQKARLTHTHTHRLAHQRKRAVIKKLVYFD